eukprot:5259448-Alexandrium_andersonii.AAC.1
MARPGGEGGSCHSRSSCSALRRAELRAAWFPLVPGTRPRRHRPCASPMGSPATSLVSCWMRSGRGRSVGRFGWIRGPRGLGILRG